MIRNPYNAILEPLRFIEYTLGDRISRLKNHHTVLFCFDASIYGKLKRMFKGSIFSGLTGELYLMDNKIALAGKFGIGCPATIAFLEELTACGTKRFVGIGSAGALHDDIKHGDVILCTGAFSDEGTSAHYPGYNSYSKPSRILTRQLALWFNKRQLPFTKGKTWTIDTPYRETKEKLKYFLDAGADVVEMESSAMFTVARFRKVAVANVFVVGDSISGGIWKPDFTSAVIRQKSLSVARDIILFLSEESSALSTAAVNRITVSWTKYQEDKMKGESDKARKKFLEDVKNPGCPVNIQEAQKLKHRQKKGIKKKQTTSATEQTPSMRNYTEDHLDSMQELQDKWREVAGPVIRKLLSSRSQRKKQ